MRTSPERTHRFTRRAACALLAVVLAASSCAPSSPRGNTITLKGSDTMVLLGQRWAERYMQSHPGITVQVTGGGSGTGIAALVNGTTDICQSSRPMKDEEKAQLQKISGEMPHETAVARDGITIYLDEANKVADLTLAQLASMYTGAVTNWKAVGGSDAAITLYGRENSSGTYEYFKEHVLEKKDYAASVQTLPGTAAVVNAVAKDKNGIGYGGAAYAKGVRVCPVRKEAGSPPMTPSAETVTQGTYPISRALFFYTRKEPVGPMKDFIDWVLSSEGQAIVGEVGYYPVGQP